MDRKKWAFFLCISLLLTPLFQAQGFGAYNRCAPGEIKHIEIESRTVVVEIPLGTQTHTVGGALSVGAALEKDGKTAALKNFHVGDRVRVEWERTLTGHIIERLEWISSGRTSIPITTRVHPINSIIGTPQRHIIRAKETLLDIAREYDLGFNELQDLYPGLDPWILSVDTELTLPTQWVLPDTITEGIIINVAELRLYYFSNTEASVKTFPIGIGDMDGMTPLGDFTIKEKRKQPTWYIPASLQRKYGTKTIPPGPENPLGDYWMGLGDSSYGIHGTDIPWSVGRLVTHGCIRMYPEDIEQLFYMAKPGTSVKIIYAPIKIGFSSGRIYAEVHRDIYLKIADLFEHGRRLLEDKGLIQKIDLEKYRRALEGQDGMPVDITASVPQLTQCLVSRSVQPNACLSSP